MDIEDLPLKFEDIVDEKTYDKMRPPKPGGLIQMNLIDESFIGHFCRQSHQSYLSCYSDEFGFY